MSNRITTKLTHTERAYAAMKKAILRGLLQEGALLSEADIMKRYGVGGLPIARLATNHPGSGTTIGRISGRRIHPAVLTPTPPSICAWRK
jgi:DNA-binding GntR family transcriptional regulator